VSGTDSVVSRVRLSIKAVAKSLFQDAFKTSGRDVSPTREMIKMYCKQFTTADLALREKQKIATLII